MIRFLTSPLSSRVLGRKPLRLRDLLLPFILLLIAIYLSIHAVQGERGLSALQKLAEKKQARLQTLATIHAENAKLEKHIRLLSDKTLNMDFLEERVRHVLGFVRPDEQILILSPKSAPKAQIQE